MLHRRWPSLLAFLVLCFGVAFASSLVTRPQIPVWYESLAKPDWRPPNWLFGPVWTILYAMMAVAGWRIWCKSPTAGRSTALITFVVQLLLNLSWSPVFFHLHNIHLALAVIVALWFAILFFLALSWAVDRVAAWLFVPYLLWITLAVCLNFAVWKMNPGARFSSRVADSKNSNMLRDLVMREAIATKLSGPVEGGAYPSAEAWEAARPIRFLNDWQGKNADPQRATEVRLLWSPDTLYLRFICRYRTLTVFDKADSDDGRLWGLWDRDVAEVFLQPNPDNPRNYMEYEISPNGMWIDLSISLGSDEKINPQSGMRRRVAIDGQAKTWTADIALPMAKLDSDFDPHKDWKVNFFRVEGETEPRFYSSWRATNTPQPNFHVPEAFGVLKFAE